MIEVKIAAIRVSLVSPHRIIVLKQLNAERYLPIWIGAFETEAISMHLQGIEPPRPMTHDLIVRLLKTLGVKLRYIYINDLHSDTFYCELVLGVKGEDVVVDCRPSDAIALAVRLDVPIYVHEDVLQGAGVVPEESLLEESTDESLDVFRDYLNQLDLGDIPTD